MRFGGRLAAAIEVLDDIERHHRPATEALKDWGISHRFAGSGDRAAIGNLVYDALRWRQSTSWLMGDETPRALALGAAVRVNCEGMDDLTHQISGDPHAPPALTPTEAERLSHVDFSAAPDYVRADVPEWLVPDFVRAFGDDWISEGAALAERPPLDLRANRLKSDRGKVKHALARFGPIETPFAPDGLRIAAAAGSRRHPNVQVEPSYRKGWFEVQDEGSQLAAILGDAKPGEQVLDVCAGAGGKTLALAATMANKGQIFATDRDRTRLAPIFERLKRAGTRNVQVREAGASLDDLLDRMDLVLVDAPCTGTGVWRRRPESKWRLSQRALDARVAEQSALLAQAAAFVKRGGRLVYVTCSVLPQENTNRIEAFLQENPAFRSTPPGVAIDRIGGTSSLAEAARISANGMLLSPSISGTDGFFVAILERVE